MALKIPNASIKKTGMHFEEDTHTYYIDGESVPSVTGFVKLYTEEFNAAKISNMVARYTNVSSAKLRVIWKAQGDMDRAFGNFIHESSLLRYLDREKFLNRWKGLSPHIKIVDKMWTSILEKYDILDIETRRVSEIFRMGYTIDGALRSKPGVFPVTKYIILDLKTAKITDNEDYRAFKKATSKNGKAVNAKLLKAPFGQLVPPMRDVTYDKVAIQLACYALFLANDPSWAHWDEESVENVERWVLHIPQNINTYKKGYNITMVRNVDNLVLSELGG